MKAFKRWIAWASVAMMLSAGLPGCNTGMKRFGCQQTSCSTQTACGDAKSSGCLSQKTSCGSTAGCLSQGCQTSGCKWDCLNPSHSKVSCASMGCVSNGKTSCGSVCATIAPRRSISAEQPRPETVKQSPVNPFELESTILPQESSEDVLTAPYQELPIKEEKATELIFPPSPVTKTPALEGTGNPFLRVSQTREVRGPVNVAAAQAPEARRLSEWQNVPGGSQEYSEAWSDALGLPTKSSQTVAPYRRDR